MKKVNLILCLISLLILGGCTYMDAQETRIRIIANSNSQKDQEDKIKLRDALLEVFFEESIEVTSDNIVLLDQKLKDKKVVLDKEYKIEFTKETFPAKVQNGKFIPSGTYMTLLITIGEGKGDNWWSVLYPEFFGVNYDDKNEIEYRSFIYELLKN